MSARFWMPRALLAALVLSAAPVAALARTPVEACQQAVREQGGRVVETGASQLVDPERGGQPNTLVRMRVSAEGRTGVVTCTYVRGAGAARVNIPWADGRRADADRDDYDRPSARQTAAICTDRVEDNGFRRVRLVGQDDLRDNRRQTVGRLTVLAAERGDTRYGIRCTYMFRSGRTQIDVQRR